MDGWPVFLFFGNGAFWAEVRGQGVGGERAHVRRYRVSFQSICETEVGGRCSSAASSLRYASAMQAPGRIATA